MASSRSSTPDAYEDKANCCPCPPAVIEALDLAVRYAEAGFSSDRPDIALGASYVKTFMEQPAEVWCSFVALPEEES